MFYDVILCSSCMMAISSFMVALLVHQVIISNCFSAHMDTQTIKNKLTAAFHEHITRHVIASTDYFLRPSVHITVFVSRGVQRN